MVASFGTLLVSSRPLVHLRLLSSHRVSSSDVLKRLKNKSSQRGLLDSLRAMPKDDDNLDSIRKRRREKRKATAEFEAQNVSFKVSDFSDLFDLQFITALVP